MIHTSLGQIFSGVGSAFVHVLNTIKVRVTFKEVVISRTEEERTRTPTMFAILHMMSQHTGRACMYSFCYL